MVSIIRVASGKGDWGTISTSRSLLVKLMLLGMAIWPGAFTAMVAPLTVNGLMGSSKRTWICALTPTFSAPLGGETESTCGLLLSVSVPVVKKKVLVKVGDIPCRSLMPVVT